MPRIIVKTLSKRNKTGPASIAQTRDCCDRRCLAMPGRGDRVTRRSTSLVHVPKALIAGHSTPTRLAIFARPARMTRHASRGMRVRGELLQTLTSDTSLWPDQHLVSTAQGMCLHSVLLSDMYKNTRMKYEICTEVCAPKIDDDLNTY